ncbi:hypothetical protein BD770DRAFT_461818 [Pilaira anomala]|nr:hypothetical protein BD770DRAFT_461818 [Pilaira anomala]
MASSNPTSTTGAVLPTLDQCANGYVSLLCLFPWYILVLLKLMILYSLVISSAPPGVELNNARTTFNNKYTDLKIAGMMNTSGNESVAASIRAPVSARSSGSVYTVLIFTKERVNCSRELNSISMHGGESIENFIDQFNTPRRAVEQVLLNSLLIDRFCEALLKDIYEKVVAVSPLGDFQNHDLETIFSFARSFFNKFHKKKSPVFSVPSSISSSVLPLSVAPVKRVHENAASSTNGVHASSSQSKYAHSYAPGSVRSTPLVYTSVVVFSAPRRRRESIVPFTRFILMLIHNTTSSSAICAPTIPTSVDDAYSSAANFITSGMDVDDVSHDTATTMLSTQAQAYQLEDKSGPSTRRNSGY